MSEQDPPVRRYAQVTYTRPPGACELLLVRHGESAPADLQVPFPTVAGHADPPLSPVGLEQARRLADRLTGEQVDAVYVTPLQRTGQTAEPLLSRRGIAAVVEPDLREVHLGDWEGGLFRKMVTEGHPTALRMAAEERWDVIPGAEPSEHLAARVRGAVQRLAVAHPDQRVVVVTHGGVIGQLLALAARSRPFAFIGADNASISQLVVAGDRWVIRRFNDTAHLQAGFTLRAAPLT